jgi:hypothetical protein
MLKVRYYLQRGCEVHCFIVVDLMVWFRFVFERIKGGTKDAEKAFFDLEMNTYINLHQFFFDFGIRALDTRNPVLRISLNRISLNTTFTGGFTFWQDGSNDMFLLIVMGYGVILLKRRFCMYNWFVLKWMIWSRLYTNPFFDKRSFVDLCLLFDTL